MGVFLSLHRALKKTENVSNSVGVFAVIGMMMLTVFDVVGRSVFNHPIPGTYQVSELLMIPEVYLALSYTQRIGGHVAVDMLYTRLPRKAQLSIDLFGSLLTLAALVLITWQGTLTAIDAYEVGERAWGLVRVPLLPFRTIIVVGCAFYMVRCFLDVLASTVRLAGVKVSYD